MDRKPPKPKKCKVCKTTFIPSRSFEVWCSPDCAIAILKAKQEKAKAKATKERKRIDRARKEALKGKSDWAREAQAAVNSYVRLRDAGKPCISCDKPDDGSHQRHASHYRSVGACSALRFDLRNIYASCAQCNTMKSGNLLEYRIRLRARYGDERIEWLESQNGTKRYSIEYLKRLKKIFNKRVRRLQRLNPS
jgi:hypothetical protein